MRTTRFGLLAGATALAVAACASYAVDFPNVRPPVPDAGVPDAGVPDAGPFDAGAPDAGDDPFLPPDAGWFNFQACAEQTQTVELVPLDLMIVQDTSYSMDFEEKWVSVKAALKSFIASPDTDGLGVALQFFPQRLQCSVAGYATPAVPFGTLPGIASTLQAAIDAQPMSGGTPTVPVLEGVYQYLKAYATANPMRKTALVLATDGVPDESCVGPQPDPWLPNSLANVFVVADEAAKNSPTINTFVIGVGRDLDAVNAIARAGGTNKAFLVDVGAGAEKAFFDALTEIRRNAQACQFVVPPPVNGPLDYETVSVVFMPDDGGPRERLRFVEEKGNCDDEPLRGWYYDDPRRPTKVVLCPDTCKRFTEVAHGQLGVAYACLPN